MTEPKQYCPYCRSTVDFIDSSEVYGGRSYGMIYACSNRPECSARVGVHKGTKIPLGTLADDATRAARIDAHNAFDGLWKGKGSVMSRQDAYRWMSKKMGMSRDEAHIGKFTTEQCEKLVRFCEAERRMKEGEEG